MSESYPINRQSEDALLELVDRADAEIEKWQNIKRIALGNLAYFGTVE
jgi:hypothetical protein